MLKYEAVNNYPRCELSAVGYDRRIIPSLTEADQAWLSNYNVDPLWSTDPELVANLNAMIVTGSAHLDESLPLNTYNDIVKAREDFLSFVGIPTHTLNAFRVIRPTITPLHTFIDTQRVFFELGLNANKINNSIPSAIGFAPESVREKFQNFTELGLNAGKIINVFPTAIGYAPESVRRKYQNFTELGLNAGKIINVSPAVISLAPESVRKKVRLMCHLARTLQWEGSVQDLIESSPFLLGTSSKKLMILARIAATYISQSDRFMEPAKLGGKLIMPLEKYLLALNKLTDKDTGQATVNINDFYNLATKQKLDAPLRRAQVRKLALIGSLGPIGIKYLQYAK